MPQCTVCLPSTHIKHITLSEIKTEKYCYFVTERKSRDDALVIVTFDIYRLVRRRSSDKGILIRTWHRTRHVVNKASISITLPGEIDYEHAGVVWIQVSTEVVSVAHIQQQTSKGSAYPKARYACVPVIEDIHSLFHQSGDRGLDSGNMRCRVDTLANNDSELRQMLTLTGAYCFLGLVDGFLHVQAMQVNCTRRIMLVLVAKY